MFISFGETPLGCFISVLYVSLQKNLYKTVSYIIQKDQLAHLIKFKVIWVSSCHSACCLWNYYSRKRCSHTELGSIQCVSTFYGFSSVFLPKQLIQYCDVHKLHCSWWSYNYDVCILSRHVNQWANLPKSHCVFSTTVKLVHSCERLVENTPINAACSSGLCSYSHVYMEMCV